MANKLTLFDGVKSVDLWNGDEGWTILSGEGTENNVMDYYKFIPTLYRAVQLRMYSVATMPFRLTKGNGAKDYDTSSDWQNKIGFLPNPFILLELIEASLVVAGRAYLFRDRSAAGTKKLTYHLPSSVTPVIDPVNGLHAFKRPVNGMERIIGVEDSDYY